MNKPSKYSKRRLPSGFSVTEKQLASKRFSDRKTALEYQEQVLTSAKAPAVALDEYELLIFIDDKREFMPAAFPNAKEIVIFRDHWSFLDFCDKFTDGERDKVDSVFISFDHWLSDNPRATTGYDLYKKLTFDMGLFTYNRMDISSHSSEPKYRKMIEDDWNNQFLRNGQFIKTKVPY